LVPESVGEVYGRKGRGGREERERVGCQGELVVLILEALREQRYIQDVYRGDKAVKSLRKEG